MGQDKDKVSEQDARRKRINLYKKIIIYTVVTMILLPTVLCILLFCRINSLSNEISDLKIALSEVSDKEPESSELAGLDEKPTTEVNNETESDGPVYVRPIETRPAETEESREDDENTLSDKERVEQALAEGRKVVYLTYDDGPSVNTDKLLNVLNKYGVKVTFFVISNPKYESAYTRILNEGHTLAMHTYTHTYEHVYGSLDNFISEVEDLRTYLKDVTGVTPFIFRFPGGSSNSVTKLPITTFIKYLDKTNTVYYDWNVSSGDGSSKVLTVDEVYNNVISGIEKNDVSVVLLHDSEYKETTLEATPKILEKLIEMDALILPITSSTVPVHHNI